MHTSQILGNGDRQQCDVLVIGGGPAGSALSALLAEKGWHVELLEKDHHPRFHIGESLLPHTLPFLQQLGILEEVSKIGLKKYGVELISPSHKKTETIYFARAIDKSLPYAFQVRRAEFDQILINNSERKGVKVNEGWRATNVDFRQPDGVVIAGVNAEEERKNWHARFIVDATGRDTFLSNYLGLKQRSRFHNSAAIFSHFEGVKRHIGLDEGNITICWFDHGWFWIIPFTDGLTSVGAVCSPAYLKARNANLTEFLWETIKRCPPIAVRLETAKTIMPAVATGNYSYQATKMAGERFLIIGDAFGFIDPVFSSGVHLGLNSAFLGSRVIDAYLKKSPETMKAKREFEQKVRQGLETYSWFIYRFRQPAFRELFISPRNVFRIEEAIMSVLAGDIFRNMSTRIPIFLFKALYYLVCSLNPSANLAHYRRRRREIRELF